MAGWVSSACFPFVVPPGQASIGGATSGTATRKRVPDDERSYAMRAAVHPLGLLDRDQTRTLDFGAGYGLERIARREGLVRVGGPYLEAAAYPLKTRMGANWTARYGLRTSVEMLALDDKWGEPGYGGSVALAVELASFAHGVFAANNGGSAIVGSAYGEGGIGGFAGVSHRRFRDDAYWLASAGVSFRLPAAVGIACCAYPK